ncbi:hypothetical protein V9T40_012297 [Parthenolecanium corni]|uniref:Protein FAM98A n=1 Tax=Parthenolecanium corni TaxID=536013 RepID=A0AAN9T8M0_9HEMI
MDDISEALTDVGYEKLDANSLKSAVAEGPKSIPYTQLVEWLTKELQFLYSLDEHVNAISSPDDSSSFLLELSSFLKEIGCSYSFLTGGHVNQRLQSESNRILLLDYLLTELKSARMIHINKPDSSLQVKLNESSTATELKSILMTLNFPKPPENIPPKALFSKVEEKLKEVISKLPISLYGEPLFTGKLSDKQWHALDLYYKELLMEYRMRREMLLKRLDVTIQSFEWSDRLKAKSNDIKKSFCTIRSGLIVEPKVKLSDVLAARKDLAILEKTSSASVRRKTKSDVNEVIIGSVPDRGGRPYEQEPPPPEMPSWQQRNTGGPSGSGGGPRNNTYSRGNSGRPFNDSSRGGRVQAGWSGSQQNFHSQPNNSGSDQYNRNNQYSKPGGYQNQRNDYNNPSSGNSYSYDNQQYNPSSGNSYSHDNRQNNSSSGNSSSYDNRQNRGGYDSYKPRGGGYQSHGDRREYQDNRNRNDGSRNYQHR